jgi:hypothetical protein
VLPVLSSETQLLVSALSSEERDELECVEKENADGAGEAGMCVRRRRLVRVRALCEAKEGRSLFGENGARSLFEKGGRSPFEGEGGLLRPVKRAKKA